MLLNNVYAFTENPAPIDKLITSKVYKVMNELNNKGDYNALSLETKSDIEILFDEFMHSETYESAKYKLLGWIFDFSPYTNRYLVYELNYGWKEIRAFNENLIYDLALYPENIVEIVKI